MGGKNSKLKMLKRINTTLRNNTSKATEKGTRIENERLKEMPFFSKVKFLFS